MAKLHFFILEKIKCVLAADMPRPTKSCFSSCEITCLFGTLANRCFIIMIICSVEMNLWWKISPTNQESYRNRNFCQNNLKITTRVTWPCCWGMLFFFSLFFFFFKGRTNESFLCWQPIRRTRQSRLRARTGKVDENWTEQTAWNTQVEIKS